MDNMEGTPRGPGNAGLRRAGGIGTRVDDATEVERARSIPGRNLDRLKAKYARSVRPMALEDVGAVVGVHVAALPDYFLTSLGPKFLALYYAEVVRSKLGISFVFERDGRILGFAAGEFSPGRFYRELFLRRCFAFGFYALKATARRPAILLRIARALFQRFEAPTGDDVARLASLAVIPDVEGRGYGLVLIAACIEQIRRRGGAAILLEVKKDNDSLIQAYLRMGFKAVREIPKAPGEVLVELRYSVGHESGADNSETGV
jgi:ribosomal protein S18 acetylase RimI-like enzyme